MSVPPYDEISGSASVHVDRDLVVCFEVELTLVVEVGRLIGCADESIVGFFVGVGVGFADGAREGTGVGSWVGSEVGSLDGVRVSPVG